MEMCYDGALVMPSSYAVMSEDEMMYVDGGISIKVNSTTCNRIAALLCVGAGACVVAGAIMAIHSGGLSLNAGLELAAGLLTIGSGLCWYASTYKKIEIGINKKGRFYIKGY